MREDSSTSRLGSILQLYFPLHRILEYTPYLVSYMASSTLSSVAQACVAPRDIAQNDTIAD